MINTKLFSLIMAQLPKPLLKQSNNYALNILLYTIFTKLHYTLSSVSVHPQLEKIADAEISNCESFIHTSSLEVESPGRRKVLLSLLRDGQLLYQALDLWGPLPFVAQSGPSLLETNKIIKQKKKISFGKIIINQFTGSRYQLFSNVRQNQKCDSLFGIRPGVHWLTAKVSCYADQTVQLRLGSGLHAKKPYPQFMSTLV